NTFLSGMSNNQHETSLLKRLGLNFVIAMKDFTTILSKSPETQEAIIAQMREIYDGHMVKYTGTGQILEWGPNGKATFLMASTEGIYGVQEKFSDMGTRAINYVMVPQDRILTTKRALKNNNVLEKNKEAIKEAFATFVMEMVDKLPSELPSLPDALEDQIIEVADFASICRSIVKRDYRGEKSLALSAEMPMRMAKQLLSIGQQMQYVNGGELNDKLIDAIFKTGFDSIPKQRKIVLEVLAKYTRVNILGVAERINYNPQRSKEWIEDLNMFGVCNRIKSGHKEYWEIKPQYRKIMTKYFGVKPVNEELDLSEEMYEGSHGSDATDLSYIEHQREVDINRSFETM
ncbi:MAG TPA: hypothetical protein VJ044_08645, partial [Candidatus Hodarchaeales archaeon]|nr:hypothetical protein [Candidatus Hodarchaeales archaeon]